ncbi:MAG TPA: amidase family protein [Candidatus Thermoplasmatota archaeon]|jgi:aspartyl-tRNA(Asn)/glutamyl-tRNA(Gln) amidotransferase subunit A|nr:amidase family protein [Candidatus Thermoplasmatota archaeon]
MAKGQKRPSVALDDPRERVAKALDRCGADPHHAFLHLDAAAPEKAAANPGPLAGKTLSVKDNVAVAGLPLTCGSAILKDHKAAYTATAVERLVARGLTVVGKTNLDEFGCGSSGERSAFGPTKNPRDPTRVPGGSSSGAGASIAAGLVDFALGSDTGGSVRCPASFCGVTALKPSYGLVSRSGLVDMAMSLEGPAPLARDARGCALMLDAMAGPDPRDPVTLSGPSKPEGGYAFQLEQLPAKGLRVGVPQQFLEGCAPEVERAVRGAVDRFAAEGAIVRDVDLPEARLALPSYYLVCYSEFASAMQKFDGYRYGARAAEDRDLAATTSANRAGLGDEVKRRILLGTHITMKEVKGKWYTAALRARDQLARGFARAFADHDLLLAPTMPFPAFKLGERVGDPLAMYAADVLTVSANLAGLPAGSTPIPTPGLPIGLQVMGPRGADLRVLQGMRLWEKLRQGGP